jgi:hypothetical protein
VLFLVVGKTRELSGKMISFNSNAITSRNIRPTVKSRKILQIDPHVLSLRRTDLATN